jgi:hypothetical protein
MCTLLVVPFYGALGVLTWIGLFGGPSRLTWPAIALLVGTVALFTVLQTISNELQDDERRKRRSKP